MAFNAGKSGKVYINGIDLSAYFREVGVSASRELGDTTTLGENAHTRIVLLRDAAINFSGFSDGTAVTGIDARLQALDSDSNTLYTYWHDGDTAGNRGMAMMAEQSEFSTQSPVDGVVTVSANGDSSVGLELLKSLHALGAETSFPCTGATANNGAATTNGGSAYLHVTAFTGTDVTVDIRHSTDNFAASNDSLASFTATTTAPSAQRITFTGTVRQYVRVVVTTAGGATSVTFNVGIRRG